MSLQCWSLPIVFELQATFAYASLCAWPLAVETQVSAGKGRWTDLLDIRAEQYDSASVWKACAIWTDHLVQASE